ncbi:MAG TPA: hypothetical protein VG125_19690 [Pirellulales bacterium]|jgi:hypothetical protein|nr:hypothetical protein [Pirellulales bacterium]
MFTAFKTFFRLRRAKKRAMLRFHDGVRTRYVDPFKAWRDLLNPASLGHKFLLAEHGKMVDQGLEPFTTDCLEAICKVFGVTRWDETTGEGLTDWELLGLLEELRIYVDEVKKNISGSPTSPEPTDSAPPSNVPEASASTPETQPFPADSGSTPIASNSEGPTPQEKPSEAPSMTNSN